MEDLRSDHNEWDAQRAVDGHQFKPLASIGQVLYSHLRHHLVDAGTGAM